MFFPFISGHGFGPYVSIRTGPFRRAAGSARPVPSAGWLSGQSEDMAWHPHHPGLRGNDNIEISRKEQLPFRIILRRVIPTVSFSSRCLSGSADGDFEGPVCPAIRLRVPLAFPSPFPPVFCFFPFHLPFPEDPIYP
jgi:hypothetical protein